MAEIRNLILNMDLTPQASRPSFGGMAKGKGALSRGRFVDAEIIPPTSPLDRLARELHWKMSHIDPEPAEPEWDSLDEAAREFYRTCVRYILRNRRDVLAAIRS